MELRALLTEEGAVSSVLGVVLMVAVTIILAAVVGIFVLGIGEDLTTENPQVTFDHSFTVSDSADNSVLILHGGGDQLEANNIEVRIGGQTAYPDSGNFNQTSGWDGDFISAGQTLRIEDDSKISEGDSVVIVWSDGQRSAILSEKVVS